MKTIELKNVSTLYNWDTNVKYYTVFNELNIS